MCIRDRVKDTFLLLLKVSMLFSVAFWVLVMLFPRVFAGLFTPDPELLAFASKVLRIYCGALCLFGIQVSCQLTFVAIGYAKSSIVVAVVRKFVLLLPLIYLMPMLMANQTLAVYIAEPVADVIAVTFTAILFSLRFRQAIRSIDNSKPTPSIEQ